MTKKLNISPGIDGIPTNTIPNDPTEFTAWFKNVFLSRWAANADVRNAIATSASVQITGDIGTPGGIGIGPNSITNGELQQRSPLSVMGNPLGVEANVQDIPAPADGDSLQRVGGALVWAPAVPTITTADSITGLGSIVSPLQLVGDSASPGASEYYGTNGASALGYYPVPGANITTLTQGGGASQVYNIPSSAHALQVICIAGGGGGGGGGHAVLGTGCGGGGAGGGGGISKALFRASDLGTSVTVTFSNAATGGNGGAGASAPSTPGSVGISGSNVNFGQRLWAYGGTNGGAGGLGATAGAGGAAGVGSIANGTPGGGGAPDSGVPGTNGTAQVSTAPFSATGYGNTGGGGGGGVTVTGVASNGGVGGVSSLTTPYITLVGGTAGIAGTAGAGGNGVNGSGDSPSSGGGGGSGNLSTLNGGQGGAGGNYGAGGGGGGASANTSASSGAGGSGGAAVCIIIAY